MKASKERDSPTFADAHTHLEQFASEEISGILQRAKEASVAFIIVAGVNEESSRRAIVLAGEHEGLYAGVGVQPSDVHAPLDAQAYRRLKALAQSSPKVVCISEVGLDFAPGMPPLDVQQQALRQQVRLARELDLPVIFHSREYPGRLSDHYEVLKILAEEKIDGVGGVFHYFQYDLSLAQACFDLGLYVSLAKPLLRLPELQAVVKGLSLDRIVLETDSYPQPFKRNRARWTEPKDVRSIAEKIAEMKGIALEAVGEATTANLKRLLKGKVL